MPDKPVHPLTLYRLTLETDDEFAFKYLKDFFCGYQQLITGDMYHVQSKIIGVESRVRERIRKNDR